MDILSTKFLNEPFYRWVLFLIVLGFAMSAWRGVIRTISDAA